MADALSILCMGTSDAIPKEGKKKERRRIPDPPKRPEGISRELYALLCGDNKDPAPIMTSDVMAGGYKQVKAKLGLKKVRQWKWMEFVNPARKDNCRLYHWRRVMDAGREYPFAKFNKSVVVASYTDQEYVQYLQVENWTRAETDHLIDLCKRFDLRFVIIQDRWDREMFTVSRSVEDLKERYYSICNILAKAKAASTTTVSTIAGVQSKSNDPKLRPYDAEHERRRKEQLIKLYNRTPEQIEEEQNLQEELRKIEQKRKEREKKAQDLQKLITAADANSTKRKVETPGPAARPPRRKKVSASQQRTSGSKEATVSSAVTNVNVLEAGIKFPEFKAAGASLRSHRMKLPGSVGQKKSKAIESLLQELAIDLRPVPTDEICQNFNELRSDMVLLYELKLALSNCEYELQTLKHQYETVQGAARNPVAGATDQSPLPKTPSATTTTPTSVSANPLTKITDLALDSSEKRSEDAPSITLSSDSEDKKPSISDALNEVTTPNRKRRAALEQSAFMKKIKKL